MGAEKIVTNVIFVTDVQHCHHIHPLLSLTSQLMEQIGIPEYLWDSALVVDGKTCHHRMDLIWTHSKSIRNPNVAEPCHKYKPPRKVIETANKATAEYVKHLSNITG